jgi:hypothetical protein
MSKTRDTGFLGNVVKVDASGNVSFVSGSTTLATINTSGQLSGSSPVLSASYASNAELLDGLDSTVFTLTSSFNAQTASFNAFSASILTYTSSANNRFSSLETTSGSNITRLNALEAATGSLYSYTSSLNNKTASFATTGSNTFIGNQVVSGSIVQSGSFTTTGTIIAQTINVQQVTSSIIYSSGSNIFGNLLGDSQKFTGSVLITGSLTIAGASSATSYSGTTIYGSTAVCSAVGKFTTCIDAGSGMFSGILTAQTGILFPTTQTISSTGSIGYNSAQGLFIYTKTGTSYDFKAYNGVGSTFMQVPTGTQNVEFLGITCFAGRICSPSITTDIVATIGSSFTCPSAANLSYGIFGYSGVGLGIAANASGANQGIGFFVCGDIERMRIITSGNVGIGTICPKTRIQITPNYNAEVPVLGCASGIATFTSANTNYGLQLNSTSDGTFHIQSQRFDGSATAYNLVLNYAGGRVGIGTTPDYGNLSIFCTDNTVIGSTEWGSSAASNLVVGVYNGSQCVGSAAGIRFITRNSGASIWNILNISTGASAGDLAFGNGTGGSGTEKMRITNGGAVGICTTSPATRLGLNSYAGARLPYINGTSNTYDSNGITVGNLNNGNTNIGGGIDFTNNCFCVGAYSPILSFSSVSSGYAYNNSYAGIWGVFQGAGGDANWNKGDLALGTAAAYGIYERMRILANGYVGIGTCTPLSPLQVNGTSGNILDVEGSTTGTTQLQIGAPNIAGANASLYMQSAGVVGGGWFIDRASSTLRGWAGNSSSGVTLYNGGTSFGTYSDERVKENIENIDTVLPNLISLRTIKYHLKNVDTTESKKRYGLIAQDLIGKFDEALDFNRTDEIEDSQEGIYSLKYSEMVPVLIKAIKELKAENDIFKSCLGIA